MQKNVFENTHNTCMSKVRNTVGTKVSVCGTYVVIACYVLHLELPVVL